MATRILPDTQTINSPESGQVRLAAWRPRALADFLLRFWRGEVDLPRAFWIYAIIYGTLLHAVCTGAMVLLLGTGAPDAVALVVFLAPLPYTVWSVVGVWRSAARYPRNSFWQELARGAILVWAFAATLL